MAHWKYLITLLMLVVCSEATAPVFLQAIASAMATIPLSVSPVSTGLLGAKLAIGAKLLYYLGYFGKSAKPKIAKVPKAGVGKVPQIPAGLQALPLPYALSLAGRFPQAGGFGGGFRGESFSAGLQQNFGFDPAQIYRALAAQGYDANTAMQILNYGAGGGAGVGSGAFGMNTGAGGFGGGGLGFNPGTGGLGFNPATFNPAIGELGFNTATRGFGGATTGGSLQPVVEDVSVPQGFPDNTMNMGNFPSDFPVDQGNQGGLDQEATGQGSESEDVESFFTFLTEMDDNKCISRLMCDIGANPSFLGEFSENIHGIVGSLDVQPTSRAYSYVQIMAQGKASGSCGAVFPQCGDSSYEVVKNMAPSVGIPDINPDALNRL